VSTKTSGGSAPPGTAGPPSDEDQFSAATSTRSLTAGLAGSCVALLTFVLIFLYPRWMSGEVNDLLFQATLLTIVLAMFMMSISTVLFWMVMEAIMASHPLMPSLIGAAEGTFMTGTILMLLEPALILFTVRVNYVAAAALALWVAAIAVIALARHWFR